MSKPLILITNDDGFSSKGINILRDAASNFGETVVVAPTSDRSGKGHSITLYESIHIQKIKDQRELTYSVSGTPVDCIKLAINSLLDKKPSLILSGVNHGLNVGRNILYSGTVSAASEAIMIGVPAIAFSLDTSKTIDFTYVPDILHGIIEEGLKKTFPKDVVWNVNIPSLINHRPKGNRLTEQGKSNFNEVYYKRKDPRNNTYFWVDGNIDSIEKNPNVDEVAIREGYVSITPLSFELTSKKYLKDFKSSGIFSNEL